MENKTFCMIQVLKRALDILELLSRNLDKEHSLREIADPLHLNHGTCANILKTMLNRGYIAKNKGYVIGRQLYYLTNNFSNETEIVNYSINPMKRLSGALKESCILAIIKNNSRVTLHKETFVQELQVNSLDEKNAYHTATGRLLLAFMDPVERNAFINTYGLPGALWKEIESERALVDELQKINKEGFIIHHDESNIVGLGVPVFHKKKIVASLGVYLPESRFIKAKKQSILESLKETANEISNSMTF